MKKSSKIIILIVSCVLIALLAALATFACYLPRYLADKEKFDISKKENGEEITAMSFNIRCTAPGDLFKEGWFYRAGLVKQVVSEVMPDVIGFQEVNVAHEKYLRGHLAGYDFFVAYRSDDVFKEGMLLAFRSDRFETLDSGRFWLSETPEKKSKDWNTGSYRVAAYVVLKDKTTGKTFTAMDTHLDNASPEARAKGMEVIFEQKEKLGIDTLVLLGDMNDYEGSPMYLTATEKLVDARSVAPSAYDGPGSTWHDFGRRLNGKRIDFFFVSPEVTVKSYSVFDKTYDGVYPSDHFPLAIRFVL